MRYSPCAVCSPFPSSTRWLAWPNRAVCASCSTQRGRWSGHDTQSVWMVHMHAGLERDSTTNRFAPRSHARAPSRRQQQSLARCALPLVPVAMAFLILSTPFLCPSAACLRRPLRNGPDAAVGAAGLLLRGPRGAGPAVRRRARRGARGLCPLGPCGPERPPRLTGRSRSASAGSQRRPKAVSSPAFRFGAPFWWRCSNAWALVPAERRAANGSPAVAIPCRGAPGGVPRWLPSRLFALPPPPPPVGPHKRCYGRGAVRWVANALM
jgi:hypothetical protein